MKSVKIQWSLLTFAVLFSCLAQASDVSDEDVGANVTAADQVLITQKINKIIKYINNEDNELEELSANLQFAENVETKTDKLGELLDWFKAYVKLEKRIIEENANDKFRYATLGYGALAVCSALTLDMWSAVYATPAAYSAYRVFTPELAKELQALINKRIRNCPESFSDMISDQSEEHKKIVKIAEEFYRNVKNQNLCEYSQNAVHCRAQEIINQTWYQRLMPQTLYPVLEKIPFVNSYMTAKPTKGKKRK